MVAATSPSEVTDALRVVVLGDSFSAGIGAPGEVPWPAVAAGHLERSLGRRVEVHNLAAAGALSTDVSKRQVPLAVMLEPDVVSVICGANDVLLTVRPDTAACARTFNTILARLAALPAAPLLMTATYPRPGRFLELGSRTRRRIALGMEAVNASIRIAAVRHDALCLEWSRATQQRGREHYAEDGLHPSPLGHRDAAHSFATALSGHLSRGVKRDERVV